MTECMVRAALVVKSLPSSAGDVKRHRFLSLGQEDPEPPGKCQNSCLLKTPDESRNASTGHSWTALDKSHTELDMTEQQVVHTHDCIS